MAQQSYWSSEQDEILIDFVRNHEALYNIKSTEYKKMQLKQKLWQEVGTIIHKTDTDCSKRWAYVRDYYIRKRGKPGTGSAGEAARKRSELLSFLDSCPSGKRSTLSNIPHDELTGQDLHEDESQIHSLTIAETSAVEQTWPRYENGDTLSRDVHTQECSSKTRNIASNVITTSQMTTLLSPKRRKLSSTSEARLQLLQEIARRSQHVPETQDETDLYFASMAKIVKKLPPEEQIRLRLEIGTLIANAELALYNGT